MILNWKERIYLDSDGHNFYNGGWVKTVTSVDTTKTNGYAFEGDFVNPKDGLSECGDGIYIVCSYEGSRKNQVKYAAVYKIDGESIEKVIDWVKGNDWALQIRDKVAGLLEQPEENPLAKFTTEELLAELNRRK